MPTRAKDLGIKKTIIRRFLEMIYELTQQEEEELQYREHLKTLYEEKYLPKKRKCKSIFNSGTGLKYGKVYILPRVYPSCEMESGMCIRCMKSDWEKVPFIRNNNKFMTRIFYDSIK